MPAGFTIPSIFTAIDKYTAPVRRMGKATSAFASRASATVARVDRGFRRLMSPLGRLNKMLGGFGLLIGGTLLVNTVLGAVNVFKDFEQANATLASVMQSATAPQLQALQIDAKRLGASTAKSATEVVGLQESFARLGFTAPDIINMTEAVINGSVAMNSELAATAELTGAVINSFDSFSSIDAPKIMDQMVKSTQMSALSFEKLNTALPIVSGAANAAGVPFTKLLALLGKLSDAGIDASSSSTALRNIFLDSAKKGHSYEQILQNIQKNQDKLTAANDEFGKRGAVSAVVLANNIAATADLDKALQSAAGTAKAAADKQLDTLNGALTILKSSYEGFILSVEDGNGALSAFLKTTVQVITDMFTIATAGDLASAKYDEQSMRIRKLARTTIFWLKVLGVVAATLVAVKVGIIATQAALWLYNVGVKAVTAAQWLWNAAMSANPIGLIIVGVAALVGFIALLVNYWNKWGAAVALVGSIIGAFFSPLIAALGLVISLVQSFRRNWDMIGEAFKTGGFIAGIKAIGATILDAILMPVQQLLKIVANFTGFEWAENAVKSIEKFRTNIGVTTETSQRAEASANLPSFTPDLLAPAEAPIANPNQSFSEMLQRSVTEQRQNVGINITDETGRAEVSSDNNLIPVTTTPTLGF